MNKWSKLVASWWISQSNKRWSGDPKLPGWGSQTHILQWNRETSIQQGHKGTGILHQPLWALNSTRVEALIWTPMNPTQTEAKGEHLVEPKGLR